MSRKQKLELTWVGKDERPRLEPRILLEDPALSYHAAHRVGEADRFDNLLIQGDNLLALKALEQEFRGQVKCIYIDPPFNTQQDFQHYQDGVEHSTWLSMMRARVELLHSLLGPRGTLCIHIDDNELAYLMVLVDEVFGRSNRVAICTFKQSSVSGPKARNPGPVSVASYVLIYAKNKSEWKFNRVFRPAGRDSRYSKWISNIDDQPDTWRLESLGGAFEDWVNSQSESVQRRISKNREVSLHDFVVKNADRVVRTARVADKDVNEVAREQLILSREYSHRVFMSKREGLPDYYFIGGEQLIFYSSKVKEIDGKRTTAEALSTIWDDLLSNNIHNEGGVAFPDGKKPEALLRRILEMASSEGDLVLDSFAGSGTTGAVAHKMGRRWIMVELGEHCHTHIVPRLRKVIDGDDPGGVTASTGWKGGGGFRYCRLAPSLLSEDAFGNRIINPEYRPEMLAEAVCKLMGYTYAPSEQHYWQHGRASEQDFLYVTTASLSHAQLRALSAEVGPERTLLVCCKAFRANADAFDNLTIQKIPQTVLDRCEWGRDDYSLRIADLPPMPEQEPPPLARGRRGTSSGVVGPSDLFGDDDA
ncbi:site-specific DNA-methyltransferase [Xanthomonas translucens]|uniref:site-specific DNA-methyltransferase n=1 Tax=Xanthomonas campestris pv. translucens TaxID=343 RepID=UPI00071BAFAE|nr:site-specific DNA-methyltransferase [Xanthomonas translucens]